MPTYWYKCNKCGNTFSNFVSIMSKLESKCCNIVAEKIITGGSGFILKGSGFYKTDYKRPSEQRALVRSEVRAKAQDEKIAREEAIEHDNMMREEDSQYYDNKGNKKLVDFEESPNGKEIMKAGREINKMKHGGIKRDVIDKEMNPVVDNLVKLNK